MKKILTGLLAASALTFSTFAALAEGEPAVQFDLGGKFDKSFNESAYNGAEKWKSESGKAYLEFEIQNADQREQGLRKFAEAGANPVVAIGFANADAITKLAASLTSARSYSRKTWAPISSVCWLPWLPRPARAASSAAWTFR